MEITIEKNMFGDLEIVETLTINGITISSSMSAQHHVDIQEFTMLMEFLHGKDDCSNDIHPDFFNLSPYGCPFCRDCQCSINYSHDYGYLYGESCGLIQFR